MHQVIRLCLLPLAGILEDFHDDDDDDDDGVKGFHNEDILIFIWEDDQHDLPFHFGRL